MKRKISEPELHCIIHFEDETNTTVPLLLGLDVILRHEKGEKGWAIYQKENGEIILCINFDKIKSFSLP